MPMPAVSSDHLGRVLNGRYRLDALLGVGASARVYLAEDTHLHRQVAVKVLHDALVADPVVRRRFATEARAAANLNHPHLLAVFDVGDDDGPYLVTEYLAGGSLRSMLDDGGRLTLSQALLVALEAVRGLEHAHHSGLVHRDIKPANLLFGADGRLRVADFGLARVLAEAALTEPSASPLGTARYASPEQARGDAVSPASDLYSLALVVIEAVTGTVPFTSETAFGGLVSRTERALEVPEALGALKGPLARAGRLDPSTRPDAGELAVSLLAAAEHLPKPEPLPLAPAAVAGAATGGAGAATGAAVGAGAMTAAGDEDATDLAAGAGAPTLSADDDPTVLQPSMAAPVFGADEPEGAPSPRPRPARPEAAAALYDQASEEDDSGPPRRALAIVAAVFIVAAIAGVAGFAWWQQQVPTHTVPVLIGAQQSDLDALTGGRGWEVVISEVRLADTQPGEIVDQDPAAGTDLAEGETLRVTVSLGSPLVPVPDDLVGRTLEDAAEALDSGGLVLGEVIRVFDEDVPFDEVLAVDESVAGVGELPQGTAVDLTVSDGPAPRTVPELAGSGRDEAVAALGELGLEFEVDEAASRDVEVGVVISSAPESGAEVDRGDTVQLVVSSGLPWIDVPDVTGMDVDEATDALEDANLDVGGVDGPPNRPVVSTSPPAGEPIQEGSEVTLVTRPAGGNDDD
jgi:eukaryotic-like serine/threonine-protein kinase